MNRSLIHLGIAILILSCPLFLKAEPTTDTPTVRTHLLNRAGSAKAFYWHGPQSVYVESVDKTFIVFRGDDADPFATVVDHETGAAAEPVKIATNPLPNTDRHGVPSLAVDPAGRLHVFFGCHNSTIRYARSRRPHDISAWVVRPLKEMPRASYPSPTIGPDGAIYVLVRSGARHGPPYPYPAHEYATILRTEDGGDTWKDLGKIIDTSGHPDRATDAYVADFDAHDGRLHMSWVITHGRRHDVRPRDHLSHAYYDPADGHCHALDGTDLGSTITWDEQPRVAVWEGPANVPRHAFDGDRVHVSFRRRREDRNEWWLATWDGSGWSTEFTGLHTRGRGYGQVRVASTGRLEMHALTDGQPGKRPGSYSRSVRSDDGWRTQTIIDRDSFPIHVIDIPRHSRDEGAALVAEYRGINSYGMRIWAVGNLPGK